MISKTGLFMTALLLMSSMPVALAIENETPLDNATPILVDNETPVLLDNETPVLLDNETPLGNETLVEDRDIIETETDLNIMTSNKGTLVRFLQLERQLDIKIQRGEYIISQLSIDTSDLEAIINELKLVKDEVSEYTTNGFNDMTLSEIAVVYIDLRDDSRELISEFKDLIHELVGEGELAGLKGMTDEIKEARDEGIKNRIKNTVMEYNAERIRSMMQTMNVSENDTFIQQIMDGELNKAQAMNRLREAYAEMTGSKLVNARMKIIEKMTQFKVNKRASIESQETNKTDRLMTRLQQRLSKAENKSNGNWSNVENKLNERIGKGNKGGNK